MISGTVTLKWLMTIVDWTGFTGSAWPSQGTAQDCETNPTTCKQCKWTLHQCWGPHANDFAGHRQISWGCCFFISSIQYSFFDLCVCSVVCSVCLSVCQSVVQLLTVVLLLIVVLLFMFPLCHVNVIMWCQTWHHDMQGPNDKFTFRLWRPQLNFMIQFTNLMEGFAVQWLRWSAGATVCPCWFFVFNAANIIKWNEWMNDYMYECMYCTNVQCKCNVVVLLTVTTSY